MKEIIVIGGANGSGKTTFSKQILQETGFQFLNADEIEKELSTSKLQAGKEFFKRLEQYTTDNKSFVLESTLSGKYLVRVLKELHEKGYLIRFVYVFLESPSDCIQRIKLRVKLGGHFIPDEDVIRRYYRSKSNFWHIYKKLSDEWVLLYNSATESPQKVAVGVGENYLVELEPLFINFQKDIVEI
ncbi:MAG: AAA family ATPase [Bacteroidia bacterium]